MMNTASDSAWSHISSNDTVHTIVGELKELATAWNSPIGLYNYLRRLVSERPLWGLAASVGIGMVLGGRFLRRRQRAHA